MMSSFNCTGVFKRKLFTSLEIMTLIVIINFQYTSFTHRYMQARTIFGADPDPMDPPSYCDFATDFRTFGQCRIADEWYMHDITK